MKYYFDDQKRNHWAMHVGRLCIPHLF